MSRTDKVKPVIKLYCLPALVEEQLQALHKAIVATALIVFSGFGVKGEEDMLVLFPPDSMKYGLGSEILVEVDLPMRTDQQYYHFEEIAEEFGLTVKKFFPESFVQCTTYRFDPANSWTS